MILIGIAATLFIAGCGPSEEQRAAMRALVPHIHLQEFAVSGEPLDNGFACIVTQENADGAERKNEPATYWVKGSEVYAVNDLAHDTSPELPTAPSEITHERVMQAITPTLKIR